MITDQDIEKLTGAFATKDMVADVKGDVSILKKDVTTLKGDVTTLKGDVGGLRDQFVVLEEKMDFKMDRLSDQFVALEKKVDSKLDDVASNLDKLLGKYQNSEDEHQAGAQIFARHDRCLKALSAGTGIVLPE